MNVLPGLLPVGQVRKESYFPEGQIFLSRMAGRGSISLNNLVVLLSRSNEWMHTKLKQILWHFVVFGCVGSCAVTLFDYQSQLLLIVFSVVALRSHSANAL